MSRAEELEAKRAEMMQNAKWRDNVRNETIEKAATKLRKEEEDMERSKHPAFLKQVFCAGIKTLVKGNSCYSHHFRPLLNSAADATSSIEKRLQSNKKNLQRSHDYMERSFARK